MLRGLYSAASGIEFATANQNIIAENLAHANVPGYRRRGLVGGSFDQEFQQALGQTPAATPAPFQGQAANTGSPATAATSLFGTQPMVVYTGFEPGTLQHTGNSLDVAATGNTFFVVDGPNGPLYTRNGTFRLNEQNELETSSGQRVRGQGGTISIPPQASRINITPDGRIFADDAEVDRLTLVNVSDPRTLQRAGTTLFQGGPTPGEPEPGTVRVEQGYRESSNVQIVNEMVAMLTGLRHYEAADRALRSMSEAVALNTRPQ